MNTLPNILRQSLKRKNLLVMTKKVMKRFFDKKNAHSSRENLAWLEEHCMDFEDLAKSLDADLWEETLEVVEKIDVHANTVLNSIEHSLGGGGAYPFLYFITRYLQPLTVVETGVATGFSSYAFLAALEENKKGTLYSSDFPYFRIPNPEKYIGIVIEEKLRGNWNLYLDGDEVNLPQILDKVGTIDIFHYDSDKSYSGRDFAVSLVTPNLSPNGLILMDDIQDNSYFYDYVETRQIHEWNVFNFNGKYVGLIGKLKSKRLEAFDLEL